MMQQYRTSLARMDCNNCQLHRYWYLFIAKFHLNKSRRVYHQNDMLSQAIVYREERWDKGPNIDYLNHSRHINLIAFYTGVSLEPHTTAAIINQSSAFHGAFNRRRARSLNKTAMSARGKETELTVSIVLLLSSVICSLMYSSCSGVGLLMVSKCWRKENDGIDQKTISRCLI